MGRIAIVTFAFVILAAALPAQARSGDMFDNEGIDVKNRPEVQSDQYFGYRKNPDMFPPQQQIMRTDKDMYDFVPQPSNPNIEKHFSAHGPARAPDGPLFNNPNIPKQ